MDDVRRALLGDHEASKRLTDAGVRAVPEMWRSGRSLRVSRSGLETAIHGQVQEKRLLLDWKGLSNQKTGCPGVEHPPTDSKRTGDGDAGGD